MDQGVCWLSQFGAGGAVQRGEGYHLHPAEAAHGEHTHSHRRRLHPLQGVSKKYGLEVICVANYLLFYHPNYL